MEENVAVVSDHCIAVRRLVARPYLAAGKVRVMQPQNQGKSGSLLCLPRTALSA